MTYKTKPTMNKDYEFMKRAIELANHSIQNGGGPFGAVVVKDNEIVATGANRVTVIKDPTAHAEVIAIREACLKLATFDLSGCVIYTSCEPCPMCLSAMYWAHIDGYFYANTASDAAQIGFDDAFIYKELNEVRELRHLKSTQIMRDEAIRTFKEWNSMTDKTEY